MILSFKRDVSTVKYKNQLQTKNYNCIQYL